ncbi:unnamed protein product, partial [Rotaria sp. Silwood1]
ATTIAKELNFNLATTDPNEPKPPHGPVRRAPKTWAITAWTHVSRETVMAEIKRQFGIEYLQYVCVAQETGDLNNRPHLHIQIILKERKDKKTWFLDDITKTHCNYQVTDNDRAWNEYIKKQHNFIEFGTFKSTTSWAEKQWPSSPSSFTTTHSRDHNQTSVPRGAPTATTNVRSKIDDNQQRKNAIASEAFDIAKINVYDAMDFIQKARPWDFLNHSQWYETAFKYIHLRAQHEMDRTGINIRPKEYTWPDSFPDCTPGLRAVVNRWIRHHLKRKSRAKCLILIGPTGTGKTSFAKSLSGRYNYFKGRWRLDGWNDYANYSIFDDIDWDKFEDKGFPDKKDLFTQNGLTNATDKYKKSVEINIRQPAIVLLNPGPPEGSLRREPTTDDERHVAEFWSKRSVIFRMGNRCSKCFSYLSNEPSFYIIYNLRNIGSNEYFYKKPLVPTNDENQISSSSTIVSDDELKTSGAE